MKTKGENFYPLPGRENVENKKMRDKTAFFPYILKQY
jgi:hypothetical protein